MVNVEPACLPGSVCERDWMLVVEVAEGTVNEGLISFSEFRAVGIFSVVGKLSVWVGIEELSECMYAAVQTDALARCAR